MSKERRFFCPDHEFVTSSASTMNQHFAMAHGGPELVYNYVVRWSLCADCGERYPVSRLGQERPFHHAADCPIRAALEHREECEAERASRVAAA